jgi:hypothetical protein
MATELVKPDDLTMDTSKSRIGNPEGIAHLSRLDSLENGIKDLQERMAISEKDRQERVAREKELQERMARSERILDSVLVVRHAVLDEWAGLPRNHDEVQERNGVAHGGCMVMDIEAILLMFQVQQERATQWEEAFLTHYGVSWSDVFKKKKTILRQGHVSRKSSIFTQTRNAFSVIKRNITCRGRPK